ncbi:MAG: hypothetical protein ACLTKI_06575 [Lachnospiraceae bacterium]
MNALTNTKKHRAGEYLLVFSLILLFGLLIHAGIEIRGLYMDDLYLWSCYGEYPLSYYIFPTGGQRFRFVFNLLAYPVMWFMGNHISWTVTINIVLNSMVALTVYHMAKRIGRCKWAAFACGIAYMLSRFSYYQITLMYGILETFSQMGALLILYQVFLYFNEEDGTRHYITASILFFFNSFVHERYMVLLALLILAIPATRILDRKEKASYRLWIYPIISFALILGIRFWAIGSLSPAGTGGTNVADTFTVKQTIKYGISQIFYLFGINAGPQYLNGLEWKDVTPFFRFFVYLGDAALILTLVRFLWVMIRDKENWKRYLGNLLIFVGFVGMCIAASSVTIRVELRWIYASYTACLLFLAYMAGVLREKEAESGTKAKAKRFLLPTSVLMTIYFLSLLPVELNYRQYYPNLYWAEQQRFNSLAEVTYETYGEELFQKQVVIVNDQYHISQFTADYFFMPFTDDKSSKNPPVIFVDSLEELTITDDMIILAEDPAHDRFVDITYMIEREETVQ